MRKIKQYYGMNDDAVEIKQYCGVNVSKKEFDNIVEFDSAHTEKCKREYSLQIMVNVHGGKIDDTKIIDGQTIRIRMAGSSTIIKCLGCGVEQDITDVNIW